MGWLVGTVTAQVTGAQPEDFLNRCARWGLPLLRMDRRDPFTLEVRVAGRHYRQMCRLAAACQCQVSAPQARGLPVFLRRFRRRYALLAGLVLCLGLTAAVGPRILTVEVTGNETVPTEVILGQLRLCGVGVGTWGPSVPIRAVENRMMRTLDSLSYFSLNLRGTKAEVQVRERVQAPKVREETVPTNVVAAADGVITHLEPWRGDAQYLVGDAVRKGEVLISGRIRLDPPPNVEAELGTTLVHAQGRVLADTQRTMTASLALTAPGKTYTGETTTRWSLTVFGHRINFYKKGGIPYEKYDIISKLKSWTPCPGRMLPLVFTRETIREYTDGSCPLEASRAEDLLREKLLEGVRACLDEGEVLETDFSAQETDGVLSVTLTARCREQIGRVERMDTDQKVTPPQHPAKGTYGQDERNTKEQSP